MGEFAAPVISLGAVRQDLDDDLGIEEGVNISVLKPGSPQTTMTSG
jgi:hypothetical protein